jgi:hypothetical protein
MTPWAPRAEKLTFISWPLANAMGVLSRHPEYDDDDDEEWEGDAGFVA